MIREAENWVGNPEVESRSQQAETQWATMKEDPLGKILSIFIWER